MGKYQAAHFHFQYHWPIVELYAGGGVEMHITDNYFLKLSTKVLLIQPYVMEFYPYRLTPVFGIAGGYKF